MLLAEPPSLDTGEVTDKGSINQRAVLAHRAALVEETVRRAAAGTTLCDRSQLTKRADAWISKGHAAIVTGGGSGPRRRDRANARRRRRQGRPARHQSDGCREDRRRKIGGIAIRCDVTDSAEHRGRDRRGARASTAPRASSSTAPASAPAKRIVGRDGPMPLADFERVIAHQPDRHVQHDAACRRRHAGPRAAPDGERGVIVSTASVAAYRRPDRPGRLCGVQGRRRRR